MRSNSPPQLKSAGRRLRERCGVGGGRGHSLQISLMIASTGREGGRQAECGLCSAHCVRAATSNTKRSAVTTLVVGREAGGVGWSR